MKKMEITAGEEIHPYAIEVAENLQEIFKIADQVPHLENLLNNAVKSFYLMLPGGAENYSGTSPKIGKVMLTQQFLNEQIINLVLIPSKGYVKRWGYESKTMANIDIKREGYRTSWTDHDEEYYNIPLKAMEDTETVMELLGLKNLGKGK